MKLFVGNLSWNATEKDLEDFLADHGYTAEETKFIYDRDSGRSRGFGFLTFDDPVVAEKVQAELNGMEFQGRKLVINEARQKAPSNDRDSRRDNRSNY